jgi:hypothetical protein
LLGADFCNGGEFFIVEVCKDLRIPEQSEIHSRPFYRRSVLIVAS